MQVLPPVGVQLGKLLPGQLFGTGARSAAKDGSDGHEEQAWDLG